MSSFSKRSSFPIIVFYTVRLYNAIKSSKSFNKRLTYLLIYRIVEEFYGASGKEQAESGEVSAVVAKYAINCLDAKRSSKWCKRSFRISIAPARLGRWLSLLIGQSDRKKFHYVETVNTPPQRVCLRLWLGLRLWLRFIFYRFKFVLISFDSDWFKLVEDWSLNPGNQCNAERKTVRQARTSVSSVRHWPERKYRPARDGRHYSGIYSTCKHQCQLSVFAKTYCT